MEKLQLNQEVLYKIQVYFRQALFDLSLFLSQYQNCFDLPDTNTPENETIAKQEVEIIQDGLFEEIYVEGKF